MACHRADNEGACGGAQAPIGVLHPELALRDRCARYVALNDDGFMTATPESGPVFRELATWSESATVVDAGALAAMRLETP